jgi:hypothetical protein
MDFAIRYQDRIHNRLATSGGKTRSDCTAIAAEADADIRRLSAEVLLLKNALWKACGDDEDTVTSCIDSQRT